MERQAGKASRPVLAEQERTCQAPLFARILKNILRKNQGTDHLQPTISILIMHHHTMGWSDLRHGRDKEELYD